MFNIYVHNDEQLVDCFTKSLPTSSFESIRTLPKPITWGGILSEVVSVATSNKNWLERCSRVQRILVLY